MAHPFLFEGNYELGTANPFDSEVDTSARIDYPHYSLLAGHPLLDVPYRGAYCMRVDLGVGAVADAYVQEDTGFDVAANTAAAMRFYLFVSTNFTSADTDTFDLFLWQSAGPVNEFSINVLNTAGDLTIRGGDTGTGTFRSALLTLGIWHCAELVINTGTGANGTCDFYLDGALVGSVASIASAALTQARLGAMNVDAGTTAGILLFDHMIADDARVFPNKERWPATQLVTASQHVALGPGRLASINLLAGGAADNIVTVYDTDQANTTDTGNVIAQVSNATANETEHVVLTDTPSAGYFKRGCYVSLAGTNPRALVTFSERFMSRGQIKSYGLRRVPHVI